MSALAAVVFLSTGCGPIEVPITKTQRFVIESAGDECATVIRDETLDVEEARPYLDHLTSVEIRERHVSIIDTNTTGDSVATSMSGTLEVAAPGSDDFVTLLEPTEAEIVLGEMDPLPAVNPSGAALVSTLALSPPHALRLRASGCFDQTPAGVELEATITYVLTGSLM